MNYSGITEIGLCQLENSGLLFNCNVYCLASQENKKCRKYLFYTKLSQLVTPMMAKQDLMFLCIAAFHYLT